MSQENQETEAIKDQQPKEIVITPQEVIDNAVKSFSTTEVTDAKIAEIKKIADSLLIAGADDKAGYKKVDTARKRVKALKVAVGHKETELLELPKNFTLAVKNEAKRLIGALKPIEDDLQLKQKAIDDILLEKKRKAEAEKIAEQQKTAFREKTLFSMGALRNGDNFFVLGEWELSPDKIKDATEEEFALLVKAIEQTLPKPQEPEQAPAAEIAPSEPLPASVGATTQASQRPPVKATISIPTRKAAQPLTANACESVTTKETPVVNNIQHAAGFESAKRAVIEILQSPEKMTRTELINKIHNLKP